MPRIDLRSDTVTRPTAAMREAMLRAEVGDDVYGEDPTVNALQSRLAAELGFDAGMFAPSGTQANLAALMAHCARGDEYLVGMEAHTFKYEGGGGAVLGSIQPQPIVQASDGTLPLQMVERAIKPIDPHFARSRLLCLENTWHGRPLPLDYLAAARTLCDAHGLALHLDGARLFNAAVACDVPARAARISSSSPGAGARSPAADHVERLADDHARAARLAAGLRDLPGLTVVGQHTNMVFIDVPVERLATFRAHIETAGLHMTIGYLPSIRMVTHLDVDDAGIDHAIATLRAFFGG
jgi:threonine aldolase